MSESLLHDLAVRYYTAAPIELTMVGETEFKDEILGRIFADLRARYSKDVIEHAAELAERAWMYTRGDWNAIIRLATEFDDELGPDNGTRRRLAQDMVERVFERLVPLMIENDGRSRYIQQYESDAA